MLPTGYRSKARTTLTLRSASELRLNASAMLMVNILACIQVGDASDFVEVEGGGSAQGRKWDG
jgi:hypothetical protein